MAEEEIEASPEDGVWSMGASYKQEEVRKKQLWWRSWVGLVSVALDEH